MTLVDWEIRGAIANGELSITPLMPFKNVQPASIDVCLGEHLRSFIRYGKPIDPKVEESITRLVRISPSYLLEPGELVLATTRECVTLGPELLGRIEGKSSLARLGLAVHVTAGFIDPGFSGEITLEMVNLAPRPIVLWAGMLIAQLALERVERPEKPYSGKYQNQLGPTESQYWKNYYKEQADG